MEENGTDRHLLTAASKGDQEAFLLLFKRYRKPIFHFLYRFLGSETVAEDITHDCFLELVKNPDRAACREVSLLIDLYTRARKLAVEYELDHVQDQLQRARSEEESVETVKESINNLPPTEREALIFFEYERLSIREIATIVKVNDEVVRTRLNRARQRLRAALSRRSLGPAKQYVSC